EPVVDKDQRKVSDAVVARQLERTSARVLMARIDTVIYEVHAVQAQNVIVERELGTVIVEPERVHRLLRIADSVATRVSAKSVDTGVDIRIKIVFPETGSEEVAGETVALRAVVTVVQVDRHLIPAKRGGGRRQVISESDDSGFAISSEECRGWVFTIEAP